MSADRIEVHADIYYSIIPEWVLYAEISANAVRLYGVLQRHADKNDGTCHPTRGRLADLSKFSRATVDRAIQELIDIGALKVQNRRSKSGDWTSNLYQVRSIPMKGVSSPVMTPLLTGDDTGLLTGDEQTIVSKNQSQERRVRSKTNAGDQVAKQWWEAQQPKPAGKGAWHSLLNVCRAVSERGWTNDQILTALNRIKAVPSVAQLDRELRNPRPETFTEKKAREEREERERIAARRDREIQESAERQRRWEEEAKNAVPPPPEFREAVRKLKQQRSA